MSCRRRQVNLHSILLHFCGEIHTIATMTLKLIAIHGWGGTFSDAIAAVRGLFEFETCWVDGAFVVDRRVGAILRRLLSDPEPGRYGLAFQKLIVSRLLASCGQPSGESTQADADSNENIRFYDYQLQRDFACFGIPVAPGARTRRAGQLKTEALGDLDPIMPALDRIANELVTDDNAMVTEAGAREIIREISRRDAEDDDLVNLLEKLRDMHETGGDLDTVTGAALYTHWLTSEAKQKGRKLEYGRDYRYVFISYHESLRKLETRGPAELYMADLPIGAFPDFNEDIRYLGEHGVAAARFEDHHPYTTEQRDMLQQLVHDGLLGFLALSGPLQDKEPAPGDLKCGADMVYESTIKGRPWDNEGTRLLQRTAHSEDFVCEQNKLGELLTGLIKGGICKVELVQLLTDSIPAGDMRERLKQKKWDTLAATWRDCFSKVEEDLMENAHLLEFKRPPGSLAEIGGYALGPGSDVAVSPGSADCDTVRILMALAIKAEPGSPRIPAGRAVQYYNRKIPEADYVFYCYGGRLMVCRRVNQADLTFHLGSTMPQIGSASDGGHAGAAVCRPDANPSYPTRLLGRIDHTNFRLFVRYVGSTFERLGFDLVATHDRSVSARGQARGGSIKLAIITLVSALIGLLLIIFNSRYRPAGVLKSNEDTFPQISVGNENRAEDSPP